ncbi:hypothetical protein N431DRAFT_532924 [Stipitochalara longipes BDJ]|nr:hypothetical protein N431DRAFT_532924 [Stipitochalara longipes BDJ]
MEEFTLLNSETTPVQEKDSFWHFIKHRPLLICIGCSGVGVVALAVSFTILLSTQTLTCPTWALDCTVQPWVAYVDAHLPLFQGIVSTVHGIGLALLAYPLFILAEAAIWPILASQPYTLESIDLYLSASRGSVPSLLQVIFRGRASTAMLCVSVVAILLQLDRIVVGQAYSKSPVSTKYSSIYYSGGGIGLPFIQQNPPAPIPEPVTGAASLYTSWSFNRSQEPMPEIRDFVAYRSNMSLLGNFSATGVKVVRDISCTGKTLSILDEYSNPPVFSVAANYPDSASSVTLRLQPRMALWVDGIEYMNETRTISTLVFAAINGTIEGGTRNSVTKSMSQSAYTGISAIQCSVDVTLIETQMDVGTGGHKNSAANVSTLATVLGPGQYYSPYGALGDVSAWLGVVVTTLGDNIYGAQPLFEIEGNGTLPVMFTTTENATPVQSWTQNDVKNFISVGSGALALAMSTQWNQAKMTIVSSQYQTSFLQSRGYLLLAPAGVVIFAEVVLALSLVWSYRKASIQEIRQARMSEMMCSTRNQSIRVGIQQMHGSTGNCAKLDSMRVRYSTVEDGHGGRGLLWVEGKSEQSDEGMELEQGGYRQQLHGYSGT